MTFLITDAALLAAESSGTPIWMTIVFCVALFLAATAVSAVITYRLRMKKLRKNKENNPDDQQR